MHSRTQPTGAVQSARIHARVVAEARAATSRTVAVAGRTVSARPACATQQSQPQSRVARRSTAIRTHSTSTPPVSRRDRRSTSRRGSPEREEHRPPRGYQGACTIFFSAPPGSEGRIGGRGEYKAQCACAAVVTGTTAAKMAAATSVDLLVDAASSSRAASPPSSPEVPRRDFVSSDEIRREKQSGMTEDIPLDVR